MPGNRYQVDPTEANDETTHDRTINDRITGGHLAEEYGDEPEIDTRCGYGDCKPAPLQQCNNPKVMLLLLCIFSFSQGFVINGINNVNTAMMERRFSLPSTRVGFVASSYEFSAAIFGCVISFFGSGRNKARWLSMAAVAMALGSFTMALPHFTTGLYEWGQGVSRTCNGTSNIDEAGKCSSSGLQNYLAVLVFGMILHGVGGSVLYTVGVSYIDDSVETNSSPMYLGIMYGFSLLGPGLGYIVGGQLLNIYVDFDKVDTSSVSLKTDDPRWVGAWWAGFIVTFVMCLLIAFPLSCYGEEMPTAKKIRETRVSQTHNGKDVKGNVITTRISVRDFPNVFCDLMRNAPFVLVTCAGIPEGLHSSGLATFLPKFIQNNFEVSPGAAAIMTGAAAVPGAAGGVLVGGYICQRFQLKVRGMLKLSMGSVVLAMLFWTLLWISCGRQEIAGLTRAYPGSSDAGSLLSTCNQECKCTTEFYEPVCDEAGIQYFSACHAGCRDLDNSNEKFSNCSCISSPVGANVSMVTNGMCESQCGLLYLFLVMLFVVIFLSFLAGTPSDAATLRCINPNYRTFSMGLKWMIVRLFGTLPGPPLFGAITDSACQVWQTECGENSSCWIYDNLVVSRNYFLIAIFSKVASAILFFCAICLYKPPKIEDVANMSKLATDSYSKGQISFENGSNTSKLSKITEAEL